MICHVIPFLELLELIHDVSYGLRWVSEQALASHLRFRNRLRVYQVRPDHCGDELNIAKFTIVSEICLQYTSRVVH